MFSFRLLPASMVMLLSSMPSLAADVWRMNIPFYDIQSTSEPLSLTLQEATLPEAKVNTPYSFDFKTLLSIKGGDPTPSINDIQWSLSTQPDQPMPQGINLGSDGVLSGTPTAAGEASFEVIAVHQDTQGKNIYTIKVGDVVFEVSKISAGYYHTCAIDLHGGAWCWGPGSSGQLGNGTTIWQSLLPVPVSGLDSGVTAISAGFDYTCAIHNGAAKCWGWNAKGQLGDRTQVNRTIPVSVKGLESGVTAISAAALHTCAIHNGAVKCWGDNTQGQLGNGTTTPSLIPVSVSGLDSGVTEINSSHVGGAHTCVIHNGAAKCWGNNGIGQLGDGTYVNGIIPVSVSGLDSGVTKISAGSSHTCAIHNGAAKCWGYNNFGQLGNGTITNSTIPVSVSGLSSGVIEIDASGYGHTCAIHNGAVKCWGYNGYGQLGNGTTTNSTIPVSVSGLSSGVTEISAGHFHNCAIHNGAVKCWGRNDYGHLGDGTTIHRLTPVFVQSPSTP